MILFDKIKLQSNHNLIRGHVVPKIGLDTYYTEMVDKTIPQDLDSYGLFDVSTPNFNTYFPDVVQKDLNPVEDDLVYPLFRALSAGIVNKKTFPTDFSKPGVLKKSMSMLQGQSVYANHDANVGNELGVIYEVSYQNKSKSRNGKDIPAGINVRLQIDGKSNPKVARGLNMRPPSIHSASVTVAFAWEPSHKDLELREFWDKLGQYDDKGELIRRVVTEIKYYNEISFVTHGADPFAKQIIDGDLALVDHADTISSLSYKGEKAPQVYVIDYKTDVEELSLAATTPANSNNNPNKDSNQATMKEILLKLAQQLNITLAEGVEPTEQTILDAFKALETSKQTTEGKLVSLQKEVDETLKPALVAEKAKVVDLEAKLNGTVKLAEGENLEEMRKQAKFGNDTLAAQRNQALEVYKKLKGDKADSTIISLITSGDSTIVKAHLTQYQEELEAKFPGTCNACGSHNVSRMSAISDPTPFGDDPTPKVPKTNADVVSSLLEEVAGVSTSKIHGKLEEKK